MSVEFDQGNDFDKTFNRTFTKNNGSKMNTFLIKHYFAKNEKQANMILLGISISSIILTIIVINVFILGGSFLPKSTNNNPNTKIIQEYRDQGLEGSALREKLSEDIKAGILK